MLWCAGKCLTTSLDGGGTQVYAICLIPIQAANMRSQSSLYPCICFLYCFPMPHLDVWGRSKLGTGSTNTMAAAQAGP